MLIRIMGLLLLGDSRHNRRAIASDRSTAALARLDALAPAGSPGCLGEPPLDAAHVGRDQPCLGPVAQHQRRRRGRAFVPFEPQDRVGNDGRAAPARGAVDEHSACGSIVQTRAARSWSPPIPRPLPQAASRDRARATRPGPKDDPLRRQITG